MKIEKETRTTKHCCDAMTEMVTDKGSRIGFIPKYREYYVERNGTTSIHSLDYCPWCGAKLPESLREAWFDTLKNEYALDDPWDHEQEKLIPQEFNTNEWWKKRSL